MLQHVCEAGIIIRILTPSPLNAITGHKGRTIEALPVACVLGLLRD